MKKIIFLAIAALAAAGFAGCTNSDEVGYDIEPKVLLPNSGLQKIILTASATDADCEVWIYRSGYRDGVSTASLHVDTEALDAYNQIFGTAYIAMPEEYYELPDAPVRLGNDGRPHKVEIRLDVSEIGAGSLYVLPLSVDSPDTPVSESCATVLLFPVRSVTDENAE